MFNFQVAGVQNQNSHLTTKNKMETLTGNQTSELEDIFNKVANETGTGDERVLVISAKQVRVFVCGF